MPTEFRRITAFMHGAAQFPCGPSAGGGVTQVEAIRVTHHPVTQATCVTWTTSRLSSKYLLHLAYPSDEARPLASLGGTFSSMHEQCNGGHGVPVASIAFPHGHSAWRPPGSRCRGPQRAACGGLLY